MNQQMLFYLSRVVRTTNIMGRLIMLSDLELSSLYNNNLKHITAIPVACKNNQLINYSCEAKFKRGVIYGTGSFGGALHQSLRFPWLARAASSARWVSCLTSSQVRGRPNASQAPHEYISQWPVNIPGHRFSTLCVVPGSPLSFPNN